MEEKVDWYPNTRAEERLMFANIEEKIDGYAAKYPFLTTAVLGQMHAACQTFIEGHDKIEYNRATARQAMAWFNNLVSNKQGFPPASARLFMPISLPDGAFAGIERFMREFGELFNSQIKYDRANGLDLMFEREKSEGINLEEAEPELEFTVLDAEVRVEWKKSGFDALELQYRKAGATMWQQVDKSTEKVIEFAPPLTTPGVLKNSSSAPFC